MNHLTNPYGERGEAYAHTLPGQASWADGDRTCRECNHWDSEGHYAIGGVHRGALKPSRCIKYKKLMKDWGPKIPPRARSCKHFEENPNPPGIIK